MFVQPVALHPIPAHARVDQTAITNVLERMSGGHAALQGALDGGFRRMELRHPALADFVAEELSLLSGSAPQTLGYFLFVVVYLAFHQEFGERLGPLSEDALSLTRARLLTDGELRDAGTAGDSYSEDLVAVGQPALVRLLRTEIDRALSEAPGNADWREAEPPYEALLVEILGLTSAVRTA